MDWGHKRLLGYGSFSRPRYPWKKATYVMAVYIVEALGLNPVKIGYSGQEDVRPRMLLLQTGCPRPLEVRLVIGLWGRDHEAALHIRFWQYRILGEWFRFSDEIRSWIEGVPPYPEIDTAEQLGPYVARMVDIEKNILGRERYDAVMDRRLSDLR